MNEFGKLQFVDVTYRILKVACYHLDTEQGPVIWKEENSEMRFSRCLRKNFKLFNNIQNLPSLFVSLAVRLE